MYTTIKIDRSTWFFSDFSKTGTEEENKIAATLWQSEFSFGRSSSWEEKSANLGTLRTDSHKERAPVIHIRKGNGRQDQNKYTKITMNIPLAEPCYVKWHEPVPSEWWTTITSLLPSSKNIYLHPLKFPTRMVLSLQLWRHEMRARPPKTNTIH